MGGIDLGNAEYITGAVESLERCLKVSDAIQMLAIELKVLRHVVYGVVKVQEVLL